MGETKTVIYTGAYPEVRFTSATTGDEALLERGVPAELPAAFANELLKGKKVVLATAEKPGTRKTAPPATGDV